MSTPIFRTAIIGLGRMGQSHLRALAAVDRFELVAVCERITEVLQAAELAPNVQRFSDITEMMEQAKPDFVIIVIPNASHAALTEAVAGFKPKAILCEKTMSTHYADAVSMVACCERHGVELIINHQRRLVAGAIGRRAIECGLIGELLEIEARCAGDFMSDGTHAVDSALCLGGDQEPTAVFGTIHLGDESSQRYGHAVEVAASACWYDAQSVRYSVLTGGLANRSPYQVYRVRGTLGELWHPGGTEQPHWYLNDGQGGDYTVALEANKWYALPVPKPVGGPWRRLNTKPESSDMEVSLKLLLKRLDGQLETHPLNGRQTLRTQAVVNACYLSALQRRAVTFPLPEDTHFVIDELMLSSPHP